MFARMLPVLYFLVPSAFAQQPEPVAVPQVQVVVPVVSGPVTVMTPEQYRDAQFHEQLRHNEVMDHLEWEAHDRKMERMADKRAKMSAEADAQREKMRCMGIEGTFDCR